MTNDILASMYDCTKCGRAPAIWKIGSEMPLPDMLCDDCFGARLRDKAMDQPHHGHHDSE